MFSSLFWLHIFWSKLDPRSIKTIELSHILYHSFLLLGLFRFFETHFTTYQFVADHSAISPFLGSLREKMFYFDAKNTFFENSNRSHHTGRTLGRLLRTLSTITSMSSIFQSPVRTCQTPTRACCVCDASLSLPQNTALPLPFCVSFALVDRCYIVVQHRRNLMDAYRHLVIG